jgi:POT family proton-dependent oligopeptide transporter
MAIGISLWFWILFMVLLQCSSKIRNIKYDLVSSCLFISYHWGLCISPVALSLLLNYPVKYASLMMGVYFAATGLENKVAGIIGESASSLGEYTVFFRILILLC